LVDSVDFSHLFFGPTLDYNELMENQIIKNDKFHKIGANVKPDSKKRIVLSRAVMEEGVTYHIYCNEIGQLILDPQISVPASEAWLYKNSEARQAVAVGLEEAATGKISGINLKEL
jgi:hypothetical protein